MRKSRPSRASYVLLSLAAAALGVGVAALVPGCSDGDTEVGVHGTVAFVLADAPAVDADELWITVKEAALIPSSGRDPVILYESLAGVRLNILEYADEDFLFAVRGEVPPGTYSKIRLTISKVEAVGGPCGSVESFLPSGHLDVAPRVPIGIEPGQTIAVRLDLDAKKSILLNAAGQSGKCVFRPVAFCEIDRAPAFRRCPHPVRGTVVRLVTNASGATTGFDLDLPGARGAIRVVLASTTAIFGGCERVGPEAIAVGDQAVVRGRLDAFGRLVALAVLVGDPLLVRGTIAGTVSGGFVLDPAEGEEILDATTVELADGVLVYTACDTPVSESALRAGAEVWVAGWIFGDPARLCGAAIHVRHVPLSGELTAMRSASGGTWFTFDPYGSAAPFDVFLSLGGVVRLQRDGAIDGDILQDLLRCRRLPAAVRLDPTVFSYYYRALEIVVVAEEVAGEVRSVAAATRTVDVAGTMVQLEPGARVVDVSNLVPVLSSLSSVRPGDEVRAYGLSRCAGGAIEFWGFLLLIEERG
ncbi:MAG: DUF4382 domain-containing protein [Planctomycetota bacterium]